MKYLSHGFLTRLISCLLSIHGFRQSIIDYSQGDFSMVSALVCMVIYWTGLMMNHGISY